MPTITKEFVKNVRCRLEADPSLSTGELARDLGAREVDVITSMPVPMRKKARPQDFGPICHELANAGPLPPLGIKEDELGYIWFVARPDEGVPSRSVRFFDKQGEHLASVPLSHNKGEALYATMAERFGVTPVPRRSACSGCGKCRCKKPQTLAQYLQ